MLTADQRKDDPLQTLLVHMMIGMTQQRSQAKSFSRGLRQRAILQVFYPSSPNENHIVCMRLPMHQSATTCKCNSQKHNNMSEVATRDGRTYNLFCVIRDTYWYKYALLDLTRVIVCHSAPA